MTKKQKKVDMFKFRQYTVGVCRFFFGGGESIGKGLPIGILIRIFVIVYQSFGIMKGKNWGVPVLLILAGLVFLKEEHGTP